MYKPLPINDVDDDGSLEKLLGSSEAPTVPQSASYRWLWLIHLGMLSLYTLIFLTFSVVQRPRNLKEVCFDQHSMYCMFRNLLTFA
jgi:hypothetical protein